MFRFSNYLKLANQINRAIRYQQKNNYSSGYKNSWIIDDIEPAKTINDIPNQQIQTIKIAIRSTIKNTDQK